MSHNWYLGCERCGEETDGHNCRRDQLVEAAENSWPVHLAVELGWEVGEFWGKFGGIVDVGAFVAKHAPCGAFIVRSEYDYPAGTSTKYPPVRPKVKGPVPAACATCHGRGRIPCPECASPSAT